MSLLVEQNNSINKNEDDDNLNDSKIKSNDDSILIRECIICKLKIQQENLCAHYSAHFYESSKCKFCDKIQTNPSSFVTHMSCHTDAQYYCTKCSKWFKLVIVYKRHKRECTRENEVTELNKKSLNNTSLNDNKDEKQLITKDLTSFGTYKIRIKCNAKRDEKLNSSVNNSKKSNITKTPIKKTFECPECDKKFVSHFGLFQHFDTHPNLAVTCPLCDIVFPNHRALLSHNDKLHKNDKNIISQFTTPVNDENDRKSIDESSQEELNKIKITNNDDIVDDDELPIFNRKTSNSTRNENKKETQQDTNKSLAYSINTVLTRNLRLTAPKLVNQTQSVLYNKTGFEDLAFIHFSCLDFPLIARYYCELYPRRVNSSLQVLHNYTCSQCNYSFPCEASLKLHLESAKCNCKYLMQSQSNFECIKHTLNNIITQIESSSQQDSSNNCQISFLNCVGLLPKQIYDEKMKACETKQLELRKEQCKINNEYINEINNYKINNSATLMDCLQKVQLKPNVNLNKALLIRSKKLKRPHKPANLFSRIIYTNASQIDNILALNSKTNLTQKKRTYNSRVQPQIQSSPPVPAPISQPQPKSLPPTPPNETSPLTLQSQPIQQSQTAKFSIKFSMTSGNFSGSSILQTNKKRKNEDRTIDEVKKPKKSIETSSTDSQLSSASKKLLPQLKKAPKEFNPNDEIKLTHLKQQPPKLKPLTQTSQSQINEINVQKSPKKFKKDVQKLDQTTLETEIFYAKCKFCSGIFKGQSEILQHVITSHQKLVKERLNRAKNTSS